MIELTPKLADFAGRETHNYAPRLFSNRTIVFDVSNGKLTNIHKRNYNTCFAINCTLFRPLEESQDLSRASGIMGNMVERTPD